MATEKPKKVVAGSNVNALSISRELAATTKSAPEQKNARLTLNELVDKAREYRQKYSASAQPVAGIFKSVNSFIKTNKLDRVLAAFTTVTALPFGTAGQVLSMILKDAMKYDDEAQINKG